MKIIRVAALAVTSHNSLWFVALVSLMNVSSIASIAGDSGAVPAGAGVDVFNLVPTASAVCPQLGGRTAADAYQIAPRSTSTMFPFAFASLFVGVFHIQIQKY